MKKLKKITSFILAASMLFSLAACGDSKKNAVKLEGPAEYPETLTIFNGRSGSLKDDMKDYNDVYSFRLLEEETGTHVEWIIPPSSGLEEKFNLMIASGEFPDVIIYDWKIQDVKQYIEDEVVFDVSDYVEEYMPNLAAVNKKYPELARQYTGNDGEVYYFPYIRTDDKLNVFFGPLVRTDWLEKLNLKVPETADELYEVLKAFKTQDPNGNGKADEIPFSAVKSDNDLGVTALMQMFKTNKGFYVENGKVKYGPMEPEFEEALSYIAKLYAEGLIDEDYVLQDRTTLIGKITSDKVGFTYEYQPTQIVNAKKDDPTFKFEGIPHLRDKDGNRRTLSQSYINGIVDRDAVITVANKNPLGTMKWFDFIYSEKGHMIMNFGKEGDTYTMVDDVPTFTDKIFNDPSGKDATEVWGRNFGTYNSYFPSTQDWYSYSQYLNPVGVKSIETWSADVAKDTILPPFSLNQEDKEEIKSVQTQIQTYIDERFDKIVLGQESVASMADVRDKIKQLGVDKLIEIMQKNYDAYVNKNVGN